MNRSSKKVDLTIMTVIYPEAEKYFDKFRSSMNNQKCSNFRIVVICDGDKNLAKRFGKKLSREILFIFRSKSKLANRIEGLKFIKKKKFPLISFLDIDDYPNNNFVGSVISFAKKYKQENLFSNLLVCKNIKFQKKRVLKIKDSIEEHTIGYGTLVIRASYINTLINMSKYKVYFFDWFISLGYLVKKERILINTKTKINYLNKQITTLRYNSKFDQYTIKELLKKKINLFENLLKFSKSQKGCENYQILVQYLNKLRELDYFLKEKENFKLYLKMICRILKNKKNYAWYDTIQTLNKLEIKVN